jgi:hypothetical protein
VSTLVEDVFDSNTLYSLRLMTSPSIEVRKELNLIHAVRKLSSLGLRMLPVKIRLEKNRMNLIKKTLSDRPE